MQQYPDSIEWRHYRVPYLFELDGGLVGCTSGVARIEGYVLVDPYTWEGYAGAGSHYGQFRLNFPAGEFSELLSVKVTVASADNGAMSASVSQEGPGGVTVFVWDSGETAITGFALWVRATGKLAPGILP